MLRTQKNHSLALFGGLAATASLLVAAACELPNTVCADDGACAEEFRCVHPGDGRAGLCKRTDEIPADILRVLDGDLSGREGEACLPGDGCNDGLVCDVENDICVDDAGPDAPPEILRFALDENYVDANGDPIPLIPNGTVTVSWEAEDADGCEIEHDSTTMPVGTVGTQTSVQVTAERPISLTCTRGDRSATEIIDGITFDEDALVIGPILISPEEIFADDTFVTVEFDVSGYTAGDACEIELRRDPAQLANVLVEPNVEGRVTEEFAVPTVGPVVVIATCARGQSEVERTANFVVLATPSFSIDTTIFQTLGVDGTFAVDVPVTLSGATSCTFGFEAEGTPLQTIETTAQTEALTVTPQKGVSDYAIECFRNATSIARHVVAIAAVEAQVPTLPLGETNAPAGFAIYRAPLTAPAEASTTLAFDGVGNIAPSCTAAFPLSSVTSTGDGTATLDVNPSADIFVDDNLVDASVTCSFIDAAAPATLTIDFQFLQVSLDVTTPNEAVAGEDFTVDVEVSGMSDCTLVETAPAAADASAFETQPALVANAALTLEQLSVVSEANIDCTDLFGATNTFALDFANTTVNVEVTEVETVDVSVDGDRNEHDYRIRIDVPTLRPSDLSVLSCGLFGTPFSDSGRLPHDLEINTVFFASEVTSPDRFTLDVQCKVDSEPVLPAILPIKVQMPATSRNVALGALDADTMILVGNLDWVGTISPPAGAQLRMVTDVLTLAEPTASGNVDAVLPELEVVGGLSPLSNNYDTEKCAIFERISAQVEQPLPTNVSDQCDAL